MLTNEKSTITIPVPAQYVSDNMIAGVKKEDLKKLRFGDVEITVFFTEVPKEQARDLISLTWAEMNFDKPVRRRQEDGICDCDFDSAECCIESDPSDDALQMIIDNEAVIEAEEISNYLEKTHERFGEIFKERLKGNFSCEVIAENLGIPKVTAWRWSKRVTELAVEYYFKKYFNFFSK